MEPSSAPSSTKALPKDPPDRPGLLKLALDQALITDHVREYDYPGAGTTKHPFVVDWLPDDPRNGHNLPGGIRWGVVMICAFSTLATSLAATIFAGSIPQMEEYFQVEGEIAFLVVCLFVLGFALGPVVWGPSSELYGRQAIYLVTMGGAAIFEGTSFACNENAIAALLVLRFLARAFSSATIANSPAIVSDVFVPPKQGLAIMVYMMFPFLDPTLGPICGNFLGAVAGWRWVDTLCTIFFAVIVVLGLVFLLEPTRLTYFVAGPHC